MAHKTELDAVDRNSLRLLATDGRSSYQALADDVGLSRPAVMERVKRLEEAGYITGYGARVDRVKAGFPVTAFVAVRYANSDYVGDEPRMREMEKHPDVLECHHVAGEDCYMLKVAAPDLERLQSLLRDLRGPSPTVEMSTRTTIVGVLLLAGGNAFVVWAEQYTASGVASIFVVTVALWMAFFDAIIPGGSGDLNWRVVSGLLLGFLGTALLVGASPAEILRADLRGPIALTCASASWSLGSVYSKRHRTETSPYVG